jgi:hypothetical protein
MRDKLYSQPFDPWLPTIEHIREVATTCGLSFVVEGPTDNHARRFHLLNHSGVKLCSADDPMQCEFYLYGYRDSAASRAPFPGEVKNAIRTLHDAISDVDDAARNLGDMLRSVTEEDD